MDKELANRRKAIVKAELASLTKNNYISNETYNLITKQHENYYRDLEKAQETVREEARKLPVSRPIIQAKRKAKKERSPKAQRERNITWVLILGVILLLISGLLLATSTWDTLHNGLKTSLIILVSVVFYGLAFIATRFFKIEKTGFAFNILGSLFLPIIFISIGFFELFGQYLSLFGEGRFIFGAIGSLIILPVYVFFAYKLSSRLYVWFSYITLSLLVGFILAAFKLPIDWFYLGIMLFNALLIFLYQWQKRQEKFKLFTKEFTLFIQTNLILSSLLLLVFFNDEVLYGFNLILTAIIYFSMIYVTNHKGYHYVFTILLVYGAYQIIEFSLLQDVGAIGYALLGFIFLGVPRMMKDESTLKKAFQYTSAIISGLAFIFITFQALLLRMDYPSMVMLIAYLVITFNFIYLASTTRKRLFAYLAPVFLLSSIRELVLLTNNIFSYEDIILPMFFASLVVYIFPGCLNRFSFLNAIKDSSRDVASGGLIIFFLAKLLDLDYLQLGIMLLLISFAALLMHLYEKRPALTALHLPSWIHPITLGLSLFMFYMEIISHTKYHNDFMEPFGLVLASLLILGLSFIWKKYNLKQFTSHAFYIAQAFYLFGFIASFQYDFFVEARPLVVLGGVAMAYLCYRQTKSEGFTYVISSFLLLFYFTLLVYLHSIFILENNIYLSLELLIGAVLLLGLGWILEKYDPSLTKGFWWVGQIYLPLAILLSTLIYLGDTFWIFALAAIIYVFSAVKSTRKSMAITFLYAAYTAGFIMLNAFLHLIELDGYYHYSFVVTSMIILIGWYLSQTEWKKPIAYYFIPFSFFGHLILANTYPIDLVLFASILIYSAGILYILYKQNLRQFNLIPLLINIIAINLFNEGNETAAYLSLAVYAIVLTFIGLWQHDKLLHMRSRQFSAIDWYTFTSLFVLLSLYQFEPSSLFEKLVPGLLITLLIVIQHNRIPNISPKWLLFAAGLYLLQPYYTLLDNITVHELFIRELQLLPWIALAIVLKRVAGIRHSKRVANIQWIVLVLVSLLLIEDGLASNTVYDALIIGTLSLASIVAGFIYKMKSFFFVGSGVLLLNVFLQTKPFWGKMPWWAYLLIAGVILITVASLNEWQKQQTVEGKDTFIRRFFKQNIAKLKEWQ